MKPIAYNIYLTIMRIKLTFVLFALIVTAYQKSSKYYCWDLVLGCSLLHIHVTAISQSSKNTSNYMPKQAATPSL